jgi:hypothetical protein
MSRSGWLFNAEIAEAEHAEEWETFSFPLRGLADSAIAFSHSDENS